MKKLIATLATATVLGGTTLAVSPPASAIEAYPLCVQSEPNSGWAAWIIDSEADLAEARHYVTAPFPSEQGLGGCSFYSVNPPQFEPCPTEVAPSNDGVVSRLRSKLAHKNAVIRELRAKLAAR